MRQPKLIDMDTISPLDLWQVTANGNGTTQRLVARSFDSGFGDSQDAYNAISAASDGNIYYVLTSDKYDVPGIMYRYNPATDKIKCLGNLAEICGEQGQKVIVQGKSHARFYESGGKLYFSTHVGYYELIDGMEKLPQHPPEGFQLYPGGHLVSFDLSSGDFEDLCTIPGEGIISMTMDTHRCQIYALSWPTGNLIHFDVLKKTLKNFGPVCGRGEAGTPGIDFRSLCRSLLVNYDTGKVYYPTSEGDIFSYDPVKGIVNKLEEVDLRLDYFGKYNVTQPGSMGYNWRKIFWHAQEQAAYGVHGNSGYLFRFEPDNQKIELLERITSELSRKCGMYDQFSYGYLGFILGPDQETIYYLTGGPIYIDGKRLKGEQEIYKGAAKGLENLHLVTYNICRSEYKDHGPIFYEDGNRPLCVNSIAVGREGNIYALARLERDGKTVTDLISIKDPLFG